MDFMTAINAIADRLTSHTPSYDVRMKYQHDTQHRYTEDPPASRWFSIVPQSLEWEGIPGGQMNRGKAVLLISYKDRTERHALLADMTRDLEDIYERLAYKPGHEWKEDLGVMLTDATINNEPNPLIEIEIELIW